MNIAGYLRGLFVPGAARASRVAVLGASKNLDVLGLPVGGLKIGAAGSEVAVSATAAQLNRLDDTTTVMAVGAGVSAAETMKNSVTKAGGIFVTRFLIDLTGLAASTTDLDIIGNPAGATSCNIGRVTAALNGTIGGGRVTCLELPAGGPTDIDFYSANESTGAQDALVTGLTETALVTSGGAWASGTVKGMTTVPPANDYLYIANGAAGSPATYTAGKFLIELYGV
jgi:hypothetical protein